MKFKQNLSEKNRKVSLILSSTPSREFMQPEYLLTFFHYCGQHVVIHHLYGHMRGASERYSRQHIQLSFLLKNHLSITRRNPTTKQAFKQIKFSKCHNNFIVPDAVWSNAALCRKQNNLLCYSYYAHCRRRKPSVCETEVRTRISKISVGTRNELKN